MEAFIGQVTAFAGNFAPRGWALCDGSLLSITQHSALFAILGATYGGDGVRTFALPDLRSRTAIGSGRVPGLPDTKAGEQQTVQQGTGDPKLGTLGMTYIICVEGVFPPRS